MNDTVEKKSVAANVKEGFVQHRTKIAVGVAVVSTAAALLMRTGIKQHNAFLKEHGLYDQFYNPEA